MITLANLHEATAQEVFDHVVNHLLNQMEKSQNELGKCTYRLGTLSCAAGCLMAEGEYRPDFEFKSWKQLISKFGITDKHSYLITSLQNVHDMYATCHWEECLKEVAKDFNLTYNG